MSRLLNRFVGKVWAERGASTGEGRIEEAVWFLGSLSLVVEVVVGAEDHRVF